MAQSFGAAVIERGRDHLERESPAWTCSQPGEKLPRRGHLCGCVLVERYVVKISCYSQRINATLWWATRITLLSILLALSSDSWSVAKA